MGDHYHVAWLQTLSKEEMKKYADDCIKAARTLKADLDKDKDQALISLYNEMEERIIDYIPMLEKQGKSISCKKGCSHCCHLNVYITEIEAKIIAEYCHDHNIPIDQNYLMKQLAIDENQISKSQHSACVFLKNNECSIYPVRPSVCRTMYVFTDPSLCAIKDNNTIIGYVNMPKVVQLHLALELVAKEIGRMPLLLIPYST